MFYFHFDLVLNRLEIRLYNVGATNAAMHAASHVPNAALHAARAGEAAITVTEKNK